MMLKLKLKPSLSIQHTIFTAITCLGIGHTRYMIPAHRKESIHYSEHRLEASDTKQQAGQGLKGAAAAEPAAALFFLSSVKYAIVAYGRQLLTKYDTPCAIRRNDS